MNKKVVSLILILCFLVTGSFMLSACKNKATELNNNMIILTEKEFVYTGQQIKPNVAVKVGDTIIDDENYTVTYSNNINVGDATLTVTAKAKNKIISGSATVSFKIITSLASLTISTFEELKNAIQYGNNGNIEIDSTITIPAGETLTVPEGINIECGLNKIIVSGTLNNNGNIHADVNNKNSLLAAIEFANNITLQEDIVTDTAINIQPDVRDYNFILDLNGFNINNTLVISNYNGTSFNRKINIQLINNQSIFEDSTIGNASSDYGIEIKGNEDVTVNLSYVNVVGKTGIYYNSNFMGTNINLQNCSISSTNEAMLVEGSAVVFADNSTFNSSSETAYKAEKGEHYLTSCSFTSTDESKALDLSEIDEDQKLVA